MHADEQKDPEFPEEKSKTQVKKEMLALQALGKKLTELNPAQFKDVPISDSLREAIDLYNSIQKKEGKRRQLQYIGKLMRDEDADAIQHSIDKYDTASVAYAQALHELESWRDRLIKSGDPMVLTQFVDAYPQTDVQHLRQLVRNAIKDFKNNKNTGANKKLFQFLRQTTEKL